MNIKCSSHHWVLLGLFPDKPHDRPAQVQGIGQQAGPGLWDASSLQQDSQVMGGVWLELQG